MRVLINAESLLHPRSGIGTYTAELGQALAELDDPCEAFCLIGKSLVPAAELRGWLGEADTEHDSRSVASLFYRIIDKAAFSYGIYQRLRNAGFHRRTRRLRDFDLYHEPNFVLRRFQGARTATVHDLSHRHHPEYHPAPRVAWLERHLSETLRTADRIITPSEFVRQALIDEYAVDAGRVSAIPLGVSQAFTPAPAGQDAQVLQRHGLRAGGFALCVCTLEPRKNLDTLLDAWQRLPENLVRETPLVLVGGQGWHADDLVGRIAALCRQGSVIWPGHVSQDCLPSLYRGAALFVYPSVYEGFGLPVLEAMASGLPVVAGRGTPAEEFAAGCAKLVDTRDVDALAGAIADALSDSDWRQQAAQRGRAVATSMSWNECARAHADVWREVAGR